MDVHQNLELQIFSRLCKRIFQISSETSSDDHICDTYRNYDFPSRPDHFTLSKQEFSRHYLIANFLKKSALGSDVNLLHAKTVEQWYASEHQCFLTNLRFENMAQPQYLPTLARKFFMKLRGKIGTILGPSPYGDDGNLKYAQLCDWSTGATSTCKGTVPIGERVYKDLAVTSTARPILEKVIGPCDNLIIVRGSRYAEVAKTNRINRSIACEPTGNAFLQKGVGRWLRKRFRYVYGCDLDTQTSINRYLASICEDYRLSTVDLENASSTIASEFIRYITPLDWANHLDELRSNMIAIDGKWKHLSQHASMGNGYIFELESIVFRCIIDTVSEIIGSDTHFNATFGDDIICRQTDVDEICAALKYCGFLINEKKTYRKGNFFESCGRHYFNGELCTPAYQKAVVYSKRKDLMSFELIAMHNRLYRWALRTDDFELVNDELLLLRMKFLRMNGKIPYQPQCLESDVGFLTAEFQADIHGDYILPLAFVLSSERDESYEYLYPEFYLWNYLRGGNTFYTSPKGYLERRTRPRYRFRKKFKLWRASSTYS